MAGESAIARQIIREAFEAADNGSTSSEALMFALLTETLTELLKSRSQQDLENFINYHFENHDASELVITRGC